MPCGIFLWSTILNLHSDPLSLIWIQWFVDVVTMATSPTSTLLMTSQLMSCIQTEFFSSSFHSICCYLVITWVWDINKTYQEWWIRSLKPTRGLSGLQNPLVASPLVSSSVQTDHSWVSRIWSTTLGRFYYIKSWCYNRMNSYWHCVTSHLHWVSWIPVNFLEIYCYLTNLGLWR